MAKWCKVIANFISYKPLPGVGGLTCATSLLACGILESWKGILFFLNGEPDGNSWMRNDFLGTHPGSSTSCLHRIWGTDPSSLWRVIMCFYLFDVSMVFLRKAPLFCPRENEVGSEPSRSLGVAMISMMEVWMPLMAWGDELGIRAKLRFLPALVASWGHLEKLWCWWQWGDINIPLVNISQNHD